MQNGALLLLLPALLLGCPPAPQPAPRPPAAADAAIALVETPPVETTLDHPDIPNAPEVWVAMIDGAHHTLDFAEFYASEAEPTDRSRASSAAVVAAVERAGARGVRVRFLADAMFATKYPGTLERLRHVGATCASSTSARAAAGCCTRSTSSSTASTSGQPELRLARARAHPRAGRARVLAGVAGALLDVLETDWELAAGAAADARVHRRPSRRGEDRARRGERSRSSRARAAGSRTRRSWELPRLVAMLDGARRAIDLQVLTYKTKERDGSPFPTLDDALRRAAGARRPRAAARVRLGEQAGERRARGARRAREGRRTSRCASSPSRRGRAARSPSRASPTRSTWSSTGSAAWVGTSNWEGDYFTKSRNVGVIVEGGALAPRLDGIFDDGWSSAYARPLSALSAGSAAPPSSSDPAPP